MPKTVERATLILLSIKDKTEIREEDWDVLKFFWRGYYEGHLSNFIPEINPPQEKIVKSGEQMLFSMSDCQQETVGTDVVDIQALTLKEEKDE